MKNAAWWAAASPDIQAEKYIAGVEVLNASSSFNGTYGILFGLAEDWSHFYSFEIDPEGYYGIWRYSDAKGWTLLTVNYSSFLNQSTATNSLKVKRDGSTIEVYANEHFLTSINDGTFVGMDYLGLIVSSFNIPNLEARFDNFFANPNVCSTTIRLSSTPPRAKNPQTPQIMFLENDRKFR